MKKTQSKAPVTDSKNLESEILDLKSSLARALADYANLERRFGIESASVVKFATANLLSKILDIRDHLEMASSTIQDQSLKMILTSLDKVIEGEGATRVDVSGQFDPSTMECQELVPGEKDQIIEVIRPGYRLHDRVLRTARVKVGNGQVTKQ